MSQARVPCFRVLDAGLRTLARSSTAAAARKAVSHSFRRLAGRSRHQLAPSNPSPAQFNKRSWIFGKLATALQIYLSAGNDHIINVLKRSPSEGAFRVVHTCMQNLI